jgi:hypothetical protein
MKLELDILEFTNAQQSNIVVLSSLDSLCDFTMTNDFS